MLPSTCLIDTEQAARYHQDHDDAQCKQNAPLRAEQCRQDGDHAQSTKDKRDPLERLLGVVCCPQLDDGAQAQASGQQQQKGAQPLQDHIISH